MSEAKRRGDEANLAGSWKTFQFRASVSLSVIHTAFLNKCLFRRARIDDNVLLRLPGQPRYLVT